MSKVNPLNTSVHICNFSMLVDIVATRCVRHKDDATSVGIWVEELKKTDGNRVILYKPQGVKQPENCDNLSDSDFVIAIPMQM